MKTSKVSAKSLKLSKNYKKNLQMMITDLNKELSALFSFFDIVFVIIIVMLKY